MRRISSSNRPITAKARNGRRRKVAAALAAACALLAFAAVAAFGAFQPIDQEFRIAQTGTNTDQLSGTNAELAFNPELKQYLAVWRSEVTNNQNDVYGQLLSATGAKLGSRIRISNATAVAANRNVGEIGVAYNPDTNQFLAVWWGDQVQNVGEYEIYGQFVNANGTLTGGDFRISNAVTTNPSNLDANRPRVVYNDTSNEYLVVWDGDQLGNNMFEVWGQRLNAIGVEQGSDFRISNGTDVDPNGFSARASVAWNSQNNQYLVAFIGDHVALGKQEAFGQLLNASGGAIGGDFRISNTGPDATLIRDATKVAVAYDSVSNEYLAVFAADRTATAEVQGGAQEEEEIFGQRVSAAGAQVPSSTDFRISTTGPNDSGLYDAELPRVAFGVPSDEYLVTWTADDVTSGDYDIFGQRLGANAQEVGSDFQISRAGQQFASYPDVARGTGTGQYMTAYHVSSAGAPSDDIFGRRVGSSANCAGRPATRVGTPGADTMAGASGAEVFALLSGADSANGGGGNDTMCGASGIDRLNGGGANDLVQGDSGNDVLRGGTGNDRLIGGAGGNDRCIGGTGADTFAASCETITQ